MALLLRGDYGKMKGERNHRNFSSSSKKEGSLRMGLGWPLPEGSEETRKEMGT